MEDFVKKYNQYRDEILKEAVERKMDINKEMKFLSVNMQFHFFMKWLESDIKKIDK